MLQEISYSRAVSPSTNGAVINHTTLYVERLADAIEKLEAGVAAREAEVARLRAIAIAAQAALADLDAFIAEAERAAKPCASAENG